MSSYNRTNRPLTQARTGWFRARPVQQTSGLNGAVTQGDLKPSEAVDLQRVADEWNQ